MTTQELLAKAREYVRDLRYLEFFDNVTYYDRWCACPTAGFDWESEAGAYVERLRGELLERCDVRDVVEGLRALADKDFPSDLDRGVARYLVRRYDDTHTLPETLRSELGRANAECQRGWEECYQADDFKAFLPYLRREFEVFSRIADALDPAARPFQVLLDRFGTGYAVEQVDGFFSQVKAAVPHILEESAAFWEGVDEHVLDLAEADRTRQVEDALLSAAQRAIGADPARITNFRVHHPVSVMMGPSDSRASTFSDPAVPLFHLVTTICHESGHSMYSYSSSPEVQAAGIWGGIDGTMHESQSRFMENHVCRSPEFWEAMEPALRELLPSLADVPIEQVVLALNKPAPGPLRQLADELTYPLHIIVRYEMERDYFDGRLALEDFEDAWDARYEELLGVRPRDRREGILQDVHWSSGWIGYFQGYALGDMYGAQYEHALRRDVPDAFERLAAGDPTGVRGWFEDHIWCNGQTYTATEQLRLATGEDLNVQYYLDYLRARYLR